MTQSRTSYNNKKQSNGSKGGDNECDKFKDGNNLWAN